MQCLLILESTDKDFVKYYEHLAIVQNYRSFMLNTPFVINLNYKKKYMYNLISL